MIPGISGFHSIDYEYQKIIRELRANGISPSGDKTTDIMKLKRLKSEIIEKIKNRAKQKNENKQQLAINTQIEQPVVNKEFENVTGAMALAELNKIYHNL